MDNATGPHGPQGPQPPPYQHQYQQWPPPPPPPARKQHRAVRVLGIGGAIVIGLWTLGSLASDPASNTRSATSTTSTATPAGDAGPAAPTYPTPTPRDFKLTVKILQKQNFGSAGSNITYRINATWSKTFDPAKTYEVTYEVRGGEDGPAINTLTVTGDRYERQQEENISTSTVGQQLTVRVLSVEDVS